MKDAIVIDANEVKTILAEKFNVQEANIIKTQYSYIIVKDNKGEAEKCGNQ